MTQHEHDRIIGQAFREHRDAQGQLAALHGKLRRAAVHLGKIGTLLQGPALPSSMQFAKLLEDTDYVCPEEMQKLIDEIEAARSRVSVLEKEITGLGLKP